MPDKGGTIWAGGDMGIPSIEALPGGLKRFCRLVYWVGLDRRAVNSLCVLFVDDLDLLICSRFFATAACFFNFLAWSDLASACFFRLVDRVFDGGSSART